MDNFFREIDIKHIANLKSFLHERLQQLSLSAPTNEELKRAFHHVVSLEKEFSTPWLHSLQQLVAFAREHSPSVVIESDSSGWTSITEMPLTDLVDLLSSASEYKRHQALEMIRPTFLIPSILDASSL